MLSDLFHSLVLRSSCHIVSALLERPTRQGIPANSQQGPEATGVSLEVHPLHTHPSNPQ